MRISVSEYEGALRANNGNLCTRDSYAMKISGWKEKLVTAHAQMHHVIFYYHVTFAGEHLYCSQSSLTPTDCSITRVRILNTPRIIHLIISLVCSSWNHRYGMYKNLEPLPKWPF